jgi:C1A family cysteine protease
MRNRVINKRDRHLHGWRKDRPDNRDQILGNSGRLKALFLPPRKDLREFCSTVENQGSIGSCTANSSTSALEFLYNRAKKPAPEYSRLFLYFATRVWIEGTPPSEDSGAQIRDVMKALAKFGCCLEKTWAYSPAKYSTEPPESAKKEALNHQILNYFRCPSLRFIKNSIADGYPVVGGFSVPESMDGPQTEKTGVVAYPKKGENFIGGHAVLFVGYNDRTGLLTFQNSWGTGWGDKGFGYLPYEYVTNWLADDFWTIRNAEM